TAANDEGGLWYAAVVCEFPVPVRESLPRVDRRQMRRPQRRYLPLDGRQIGDPRHSNPPVAPGAPAQPLDQVIAVLGLSDPSVPQLTFRIPASARVRIHHRIAVATPVQGVGSLERRMAGNPPGGDVRGRPGESV